MICFGMMHSDLVVSLVIALDGHRLVHYNFTKANLNVDRMASSKECKGGKLYKFKEKLKIPELNFISIQISRTRRQYKVMKSCNTTNMLTGTSSIVRVCCCRMHFSSSDLRCTSSSTHSWFVGNEYYQCLDSWFVGDGYYQNLDSWFFLIASTIYRSFVFSILEENRKLEK